MQVPKGYQQFGTRATGAVLRSDLGALPLDRLWAPGEPLASARGRGGIQLLDLDGVPAAVRDYRRGGFLGGLLGARYPGPGRACRELVVHAALRARGVAVVPPLGIAWRRHGLWWQLRFITELVAGAVPLTRFVVDAPPLRSAAIRAAGREVGAALAAGLVHPDLHPDNLIARPAGDGAAVWLLDFDRARLVAGTPVATRDAMLVRMARYLYRHAERLGERPRPRDMARFLRGMGMDRGSRRDAMARLGVRLRAALRRRGLDAG